MKVLLLSLVLLPLLAVTPGAIWQAVASGVATLITGGLIVGVSWKWAGAKVYRAVRDFFKDHKEMRKGQVELKETTERLFEEFSAMTGRRFTVVEEKADHAIARIAESDKNTDAAIRQINAYASETREQLAELRGEVRGAQKERERMTGAARAIGQAIEQATHTEEAPPP